MAGRGRPRKVPIIESLENGDIVPVEKVECNVECAPIALLSVDYSSEGLNNMAKKINEIIEKLNNK